VKKVVFFERGQPVFALSNLLADRFGQFLVRTGRVRPEQLADAAQVAQRSGRRTGDVLVERGLLTDADRSYYLGQQVKAIIYSLFAWEDGSYVMSFGAPARQEVLKLDVHPATLIVRGMKKLYKPERVRRLLALEDRLMPSRQSIYPTRDLALERWETELMPLADGSRTVAELIALAKRPEGSVLLSLAVLLALQVLEKS
jgi:two-component system, OmpR family, response regulator